MEILYQVSVYGCIEYVKWSRQAYLQVPTILTGNAEIELFPQIVFLQGTTAIDMKQNIVYGITGTAGERQPTTDDIELQPNVLYGTTGQQTGPGSGDQTTYVNEGLGPTAAEKDPATEYEYIQI